MSQVFLRRFIAAISIILFSIGHSAETTSYPAPGAANALYNGKEISLMGGKCQIRIEGFPDGSYIAHNSEKIASIAIPQEPTSIFGRTSLRIPLYCTPLDDVKSIETTLGAKQVNGEWRPAGGYEKGCDHQIILDTGRCEDSENLPFFPDQNMKHVDLKGKNWHGTGILVDQNTGDEDKRMTEFRFCLFNKVAICGWVLVRPVGENPPYDFYDRVLSVLEGITFVDDSSSSDK